MNMSIVKQLIRKDFEMNQGPLLGYMLIGALALWFLIIESHTFFMVGLIMLISTVIIIGIHMVIATIINERKNQTLAFVISLPVSFKEYTLSKILANWIVVGSAWLILYLCMVGLILLFKIPDGFIPYGTMTMVYLLCLYAVLLATALVSENEIVTIVVMTVANISISIFMMAVAKMESIGPFIEGPEPVWNAPTLTIIAAQFGVIILTVMLTFYFQSKKRNYL